MIGYCLLERFVLAEHHRPSKNLFHIFQILGVVGTTKIILVCIVLTMVLIVVAYFTISSWPLFSEFYVCHYSCCPHCSCISYYHVRGHDGRHQQILVIRDSNLLYPLLLSQLKATGTTNIPILFVFMICNQRLMLNKA